MRAFINAFEQHFIWVTSLLTHNVLIKTSSINEVLLKVFIKAFIKHLFRQQELADQNDTQVN